MAVDCLADVHHTGSIELDPCVFTDTIHLHAGREVPLHCMSVALLLDCSNIHSGVRLSATMLQH